MAFQAPAAALTKRASTTTLRCAAFTSTSRLNENAESGAMPPPLLLGGSGVRVNTADSDNLAGLSVYCPSSAGTDAPSGSTASQSEDMRADTR